MTALECTVELSKLLDKWANERPTGEPLLDLLKRIAYTIECATETYLKQDPDPFDDRHPCRSNPDCALGHMLKKIMRNEDFTSALCAEYLDASSGIEINTVSCRILLDLTPGLDIELFVSIEGFVDRFITWAERAQNPLRSYAVAVLAVLLENEDVSRDYREKTACLAPVMLERLHDLSGDYFKTCGKKDYSFLDRPFAHLNKESDAGSEASSALTTYADTLSSPGILLQTNAADSSGLSSKSTLGISELSSSSWSDMEPLMIGSHQIYPLTLADELRYILQYLTSVADYQELMANIYSEKDKTTIRLLLKYIDFREQPNIRLSFDALKFIAVLLSHKKCALEFICKENINKLLNIHRPSLAATGVSYVLYYLGYIEDALKKICHLSRDTIWNLVSYALWLLECSHATGRNHAVIFFGSALQHDVIRSLFTEQDGLRKLLNVMSTLDVVVQNLTRSHRGGLSMDTVTSSRHMCRHVCVTLRKLYESYAESLATSLVHFHTGTRTHGYSQRLLEENIEIILKNFPSDYEWEPAEQLLKLDGISLLLKIIVMNFDWNYSGKGETIKTALDVLFVCTVSNKVKLAVCETVTFMNPYRELSKRSGMSILLQAASSDTLTDGDIRRSALNVIANCVCIYHVHKIPDQLLEKQNAKKIHSDSSTDVMNEIWNCVRLNSGIMVLCGLLSNKCPVTDADAIRSLACQALCGLANYPKVMQIISNLPLIASGELQDLMREPVLRDKRREHAKFVKYGKKLMEMAIGRTFDTFACNLRKAEIVSETVINYNETQLLHLIVEHLYKKGYITSAATLQKEASLQSFDPFNSSHPSSSKCPKDGRKLDSFEKVYALDVHSAPSKIVTEIKSVSLDSIVSEYLRNQHALCKNPYVTCPPFDLYTPHQCSEASLRNAIPNNMCARLFTKQHSPSYWGRKGSTALRKYFSSRFEETHGINLLNEELTVCGFKSAKRLYTGTHTGSVKVFGVDSREELFTFQAHENIVTNMQFFKNSPLFLTSSSWRTHASTLWDASQNHQLLYHFPEESYAEFSKLNQDRIIGTYQKRARIYDVETGVMILTLDKQSFGNLYRHNKATFNYTDDIVLSDGIIWDVRSGRIIHKLDKFNSNINGVFHPNGIEIVSNSEVWDARTYRLLRTLPELENCKILFDSTGDVIYGAIISREADKRNGACFKRYGTSVRSFDAVDYTCITTKDTQKGIHDFALETTTDRFLAVVQKALPIAVIGRETICRVYEIGCTREDNDSDEEIDPSDDLDDDDSQGMQQSDEEEEEEEEDQQNGEPDDHAESDRESADSGSSDGSSSSSRTDEEFYFSFMS